MEKQYVVSFLNCHKNYSLSLNQIRFKGWQFLHYVIFKKGLQTGLQIITKITYLFLDF